MGWFTDLGNDLRDFKDVILSGKTKKELDKAEADERYWRGMIAGYTPYVLGGIGVLLAIWLIK